MGTTSHLDLVKSNFALRSDLSAQIRELAEKATTENRSLTADESTKIDEVKVQLNAADERISTSLEIEGRSAAISDGMSTLLGALVDRDSGEVLDTRSVGERFVTDEVRNWVANGARGNSPTVNFTDEFRAVTNTTTGLTSGGAFVQNQVLDRVGSDFLDRKVFLSDLLPTVKVSTGAIEYVQDKTPLADIANKAATVAEGGDKPQAGGTFAVITEAAATIAAWTNLTRQVAADAPQVVSYLDGRLRYGLKRTADAQVISGPGTGSTLLGLANRSGIVTYAPGAAEARYKSIRRGIRLMEDAESVPEIIVLNPADAELFDLSNDATAGLHATPDLASAGARSAWGLTQVRSTAVTAGTALLIDPMAVAIFDRQDVAAYMTDSHASNFIANILTLLLECRLGLGLFDPAGVAKVTFNGAA